MQGNALQPLSWDACLQKLLSLLQPTSQTPLLFKRVCQLLSSICQQQGAVTAAALFLHLSLGTSLCCQQQMLVGLKQQHQQERQRREAARNSREQLGSAQDSSSSSTMSSSKDTNGGSSGSRLSAETWEHVQSILKLKPLLEELASACPAAAAAAAGGGVISARSCGTVCSCLDKVAEPWLDKLMSYLPDGCVACSIVQQSCAVTAGEATGAMGPAAGGGCGAAAPAAPAGDGGLLVCRCIRGQVPVMAVLQASSGSGSSSDNANSTYR